MSPSFGYVRKQALDAVTAAEVRLETAQGILKAIGWYHPATHVVKSDIEAARKERDLALNDYLKIAEQSSEAES